MDKANKFVPKSFAIVVKTFSRNTIQSAGRFDGQITS